MRKLRYFLRVIIISPEATILLLAYLALTFSKEVSVISQKTSIVSEAVKTIALVSGPVLVWIFMECQKILFPTEKQGVLQVWEGYWQLRIHSFVSLIYSVVFFITPFLLWALNLNLKNPSYFILFLCSLLGQFILALSVYHARIRIREIILCAENNGS